MVDHEKERISQLEKRLSEVEQEVNLLKEKLYQVDPHFQLRQLNKKQEHSTSSSSNQGKPINKSSPHLKHKTEKVDMEKLVTKIWLPRIFMIVLLLGVLWGFKVVVDYGFLTPIVRIFMGYVFGGFLVYFGLKQMKKKREKLGIVLLGGAYSVFLFTTFAGSVLYGYFSSLLAFLLNIIWLSIGLFYAWKYNSQVMGIFIAIGGYFIPFLIKSGEPNIWSFTIYETILFLVLLFFSLYKKFVRLYYASFSLLHITFFIYLMIVVTTFNIPYTPLAYGIIAQFIVITATYMKNNLFMKQQMTTLFTSFALTSGWMHFIFIPLNATLFSFFTTIVFLLLTVYFFQKDKDRMITTSIVFAFSLILWLYRILDGNEIIPLLLVEGTMLLYIGWYFHSNIQKFCGSFIYGFTFLASIKLPFVHLFSLESFIWITLLITIGFVFYGVLKYEKKSRGFFYFLLILNVIVWLRYTFLLTLWVFHGVDENITQMIISFEWAILAALIVTIGINRKKKNIRFTGIGLLSIVLCKVIFYDLFMVPITIRAILFIGIGMIGIFISRLFYNQRD